MPTRNLVQPTREDEERLARLRGLASKGFAELDQGQGTVLEGEGQVSRYIRKIGERSSDAKQ